MAETRRTAPVQDQESAQQDDRRGRRTSEERGRRPDRSGSRSRVRISGGEAARTAKEQLEELTGHESESVSAMTRTDDGWLIRVEMVELERVPPTTNVMGSYEVEVDGEGEMVGYELTRRYHRGQVGGEEQ